MRGEAQHCGAADGFIHAFIFDFAKEDGKQTLVDIENMLSEKFPVKLKTGEHYGALH